MPPKRRYDRNTLDLFRDAKPETEAVVVRYAAEETRAFNLEGRMAKAIKNALAECTMSRKDIADEMSAHLGEQVTVAQLESWASQGKGSHRIPATRLAALAHVTDDPRPLNTLLEDLGLIVVDARYEALLVREKASQLAEHYIRQKEAADAEWKAKR